MVSKGPCSHNVLSKSSHGWFYEVSRPSPLSCVSCSEKHLKAIRKRKEEAVFSPDEKRPSFFAKCSIEFLFGQKNGTDSLKSESKKGLMTPKFFGEIISFKIHPTDFCVRMFSYYCVKNL